ncbi:MAG: VWA domain-containing protein, partial [Comamonadaceae bacterium]
MNPDGTYTYTAPAFTNAADQIDSFVYRAYDGSLNTGWTTVTIAVQDSAPTATNDVDTVVKASSTTGNVVAGTGGPTADIIASDSVTVTNVVMGNGRPVVSATNSGGVRTIDTGSGILTIDQSGEYTYVARGDVTIANNNTTPATAAQWATGGVSVHGIVGAPTLNGANGLVLGSIPAAGTNVGYNNGATTDDGLGVTGGATSRLNTGESLVFNMGRLASSANFTLSGLGTGETVGWFTYDVDGTLLNSGTFTNTTAGNITSALAPNAFYYVRFTPTSGDGLRINGVAVTAATPAVSFDYTITDADGDTSTASLAVNTVNTVTANADTASVSEAGLPDGTAPDVATTMANGNLLDNDTGASPSTTVLNVGGVTPTGNVITVSDAYGTLQVWTAAIGGHRVGDYVYTLNDNTPANSVSSRSFTYAVTGGSTSSLTVNIVDDAPSATSAVAEVSEAPAATYNLVLMLDISASMYANNAGGVVRSVDANGNAVETTRLAMAKAGLVALVEEYFEQSAGVTVKLGLFANGSTMLNGGAGYTSKAALIAAIQGITGTELTSATDYEDGIAAMQTAFGTPSSAVTNVSYFLSDGAPTSAANATAAINTYRAF